MSKKKHPNACPSCERIPCQCASGGGGGDEEKSKSEDQAATNTKSNESSLSTTMTTAFVLDSKQIFNEGTPITLLNQENQLLYCTLFAPTADQLAPELSNDLQEDGTSNVASTPFTLTMTTGGDE